VDESCTYANATSDSVEWDPVVPDNEIVVEDCGGQIEVWEHCYTCGAGDLTPSSARRLTPNDRGMLSFFRQWKP
jgi:hypothetical protein